MKKESPAEEVRKIQEPWPRHGDGKGTSNASKPLFVEWSFSLSAVCVQSTLAHLLAYLLTTLTLITADSHTAYQTHGECTIWIQRTDSLDRLSPHCPRDYNTLTCFTLISTADPSLVPTPSTTTYTHTTPPCLLSTPLLLPKSSSLPQRLTPRCVDGVYIL